MLANNAILSAWTVAEIESPFPSASVTKVVGHVNRRSRDVHMNRWIHTRVTRLTDFSAPPIQVVALFADPISRLMFDGAAIAGVENRGIL